MSKSSFAATSCRIPSYRRHKPSGQALVTLDGRDYYLGVWNTAASRTAYERLIAEWLAAGKRMPGDKEKLTVNELILAYWKHAEGYYRTREREPSKELDNVRDSLRHRRVATRYEKTARNFLAIIHVASIMVLRL